MSVYDARPCPCGSGKSSWWAVDGRGIPLCRVCPACEEEKMKQYRPEILEPYGPEDVDETIEPEEYY